MALTVTPEDLMNLANQIAQYAQDMNDQVKVLDSKIDAVSTSWTGISSNTFYNKYVEMQPTLHAYAEVVQAIANVAQTAAKAYDDTDVELSEQMKG